MRPHLVSVYPDAPDHRVVDRGEHGRLVLVNVDKQSRWFDQLVIGTLPAGATDGPRVYPPADDVGGPETWYCVVDGEAELARPDGTTATLRAFDTAYFPPGAGGELRNAGERDLTWFAVSSNGDRPSAYAEPYDWGAALVKPLDGAAAPKVFWRHLTAPRQWPANELGASAKPWWYYTVADESTWFHTACISCIPPGGASTFHTHMTEFEGPYETWYLVVRGRALIRNEHEDFYFPTGPSGVFVPADASHQMINNGDDFLWYLTISSRGSAPLALNTYDMPSGVDRPGYLDEYHRIIDARRSRGLPTP